MCKITLTIFRNSKNQKYQHLEYMKYPVRGVSRTNREGGRSTNKRTRKICCLESNRQIGGTRRKNKKHNIYFNKTKIQNKKQNFGKRMIKKKKLKQKYGQLTSMKKTVEKKQRL